MSDQPSYCPKCGAPRDPGASFCSKCGASFATTTPGPGSQPMDWREQRRQWRAQRRAERWEGKHEKSEKGEKAEKPEKGHGNLTGPVIGGGILIWLGLLVYLQAVGTVRGSDVGGFFLMGIGVMIILGGVVGSATSGRPLIGYLVGGVVLIILGAIAITGFSTYAGALFLVFLGLVVLFFGISARRRSPPPSSAASM